MIIAAFKKNDDFVRTSGLWQWDYGQILRIQGLDLPTAVEIHFSLQRTGGDSITRVGVTKDGVTDVPIPDSMLENDGATQVYDVYAFVYMTDDVSGETVKYVAIKTDVRPKPEAFDTPEEAELFREAISAVNAAADRAEEAAKKEVTDGRINDAVDDYLNEHGIKESDPTVPDWAKQPSPDKTLSQDGQAADAKTVGNELEKKADKDNADFTGNMSMERMAGADVGDHSVALGYNNAAIGEACIAVGKNNIAGCKGYYIKSIDTTNKKIYLCNEKISMPVFSEEDNTDLTFETPIYEVENTFVIANHLHYIIENGIVSVSNNVVTYNGDLGFTKFENAMDSRNGIFYVPSKPFTGNIALTEIAFVEGYENTSIGYHSHSEGCDTLAIGDNSHTEGYGTVATGGQSHAEGYKTEGIGYVSHAEGYKTKASGYVSHAEGYEAEASGSSSHAEGSYTKATGGNSHAEGHNTLATGDNSHAEGYSTNAIGKCSHAEGEFTEASGYASNARGTSTKASGKFSSAEGASTIATGDISHAEGYSTNAIGKCSHAEGYEAEASGSSSHAEGSYTKATGGNSHAEGHNTLATGDNSHAEGYSTNAIGKCSHAEGEFTEASGYASNARGTSTKASGKFSSAEGASTIATGDISHAEGYSTNAIGKCSHAEGEFTEASGYASNARGTSTKASGMFSSAEGASTIATGNISHVQGKYNKEDTEAKYAHIVGNGSYINNRSNIHTVDWSGNAWYQGSVTSTGADYAEFFEWLDGNPDNEDRVGLLVALDGEKIKLANAGDEILGIISGTAAVLGDNYECEWNGKYLTDDFGRIIYDMVEEFIDIPTGIDEETGEAITEKQSIGFFNHPRLNPDYDPEQAYINRADRPEWATVGMLGKLYLRDDGSCMVNGYAAAGENGIATASTEKTNMRVLSRVNENVVRVLVK